MIPLVVEAAARSLVLGLLVWATLAAVRPRNPYLQKTVWLGVLLASLAMPVLLWLNIAPAIEAPTYLLSLRATDSPIAEAFTGWVSFGAGASEAALVTRSAAAIYALVTLALLARFATSLLRMWRIRRNAQPVQASWAGADEVRVSASLFSPATFGSTILLPADFETWSAPKLAAVLCHERSHVRQKDCHVLWLARVHAYVFWINPVAWLIVRRLAALAETTSDDAVVTEIGDRPAYAEVLLEIATARPASAVALAVARANVAVRIERIISDEPPAPPPKRWHKALSVALLLPVVTISAASLQLPAMALARADNPPAAAEASDATKPRLVSTPPVEEQREYYPKKAKQLGREGLVQIAISLDSAARVTGTRILEEEPLDVGFGEAASQIVRKFEYANPTGRAAELSIRVKFELDRSPADEVPPSAGRLGG